MQIYITRGSDSSGPYSLEDVQTYLEQGMLLPDDLAYHEGLPGWTPLEEVLAAVKPASAPAITPPVPSPVAEVSKPVAAVTPASVVAPPAKSKKALVIAAAVAGLAVFGGVGTVVYLKFIKGGEETQAEVAQGNPPSKKISAYARQIRHRQIRLRPIHCRLIQTPSFPDCLVPTP